MNIKLLPYVRKDTYLRICLNLHARIEPDGNAFVSSVELAAFNGNPVARLHTVMLREFRELVGECLFLERVIEVVFAPLLIDSVDCLGG